MSSFSIKKLLHNLNGTKLNSEARQLKILSTVVVELFLWFYFFEPFFAQTIFLIEFKSSFYIRFPIFISDKDR